MKGHTKEILIVSILGLGGLAFWLYIKKRNEKEVAELTKFINESYTQNDLSKLSEEVVNKIQTLPLTKGNLMIDNIPDSDKDKFRSALANLVVNLNLSIKGPSTNVNLFFTNFYRIKNKATMRMVDALYKSLYGETLFDAIQGESLLYTGTIQKLAIDPFGILAKDLPSYNPYIIKYLALLK